MVCGFVLLSGSRRLILLCVAVVFLAIVFLLCWCGLCRSCSRTDFWSGMVSDGFQTQKRGSWIPGKEREERVLASAISTDGRKDGTCKFCSEPNVWTRWRCRRCYHDILAGLRGKYRQAIARRTGEWSAVPSTSSWRKMESPGSLEEGHKEFRARLETLKKG